MAKKKKVLPKRFGFDQRTISQTSVSRKEMQAVKKQALKIFDAEMKPLVDRVQRTLRGLPSRTKTQRSSRQVLRAVDYFTKRLESGMTKSQVRRVVVAGTRGMSEKARREVFDLAVMHCLIMKFLDRGLLGRLKRTRTPS